MSTYLEQLHAPIRVLPNRDLLGLTAQWDLTLEGAIGDTLPVVVEVVIRADISRWTK